MIRFLSLCITLVTLHGLSYGQTAWTNRASNAGDLLYDVTFTEDAFIVVGTTTSPVTVLTSPDAINWTRQTTSIGGIFHSVAYGNDRIVAVGTNSASSIAAVSTDNGVTWDGGLVGIGLKFEGVTWTGTEFIAVGATGGNAMMATSADGASWSGGPVGNASDLKGVVQGGTTRVAVGTTRVILYSLNGGDWNAAPNTPNVDWEDVSYAAGLFLVVGVQGQIMTSSDGVAWTLGSSGTGDNVFATTALGEPEVWVATGSNGRIIVSNNAENWTTVLPAPTADPLFGIAYGVPSGGTTSMFVAVGQDGRILSSPGPDLGGSTPAAFSP